MEYKEYMNLIRQKLSIMSEEEKNQWIYHYARVRSKNKREDMLDSLNFHRSIPVDFNQDIFNEFIESVKNEELEIPATEEEYGYGYDSDYETYYMRDCELLNQLNGYIQYAFMCANACYYKQAFAIFKQLQSLTYFAILDYGDYIEMDFYELFKNNLIDVTIEQYSLYYLYVVVQMHLEIPETFSYFKNSRIQYVFSDLMAFGPEEILLTDNEYQNWIAFLKNETGHLAESLLKDICLLYGDITQLTKMALQIGIKHPMLYLDVIRYHLSHLQRDEARQIATNAFEQLDKTLIIRSTIANTLIPYFKNEKELYEIAFLSNPQVEYCLRLYSLDCDIPQIKTTFQKIDYCDMKSVQDEELKSVSLSSVQKQILLFLLGDYKDIICQYTKDASNHEWSSNLKGTIISLLLMYLKPEKKYYVADDEILKDLSQNFEMDKYKFYEYFHIWKEKYAMDNEFKRWCIQWLKQEIDQNAQSIVGETYRYLYYTVAKQIVVLAEILQFYEDIDSIETFLQSYIKKYSRKYAFKAEVFKYSKQKSINKNT